MVEGKQVARFFTVGLVAFEIVDRRAHRLSGGFVRAHGVHAMANHLQGLERHHHFIVFDVIADQHQNFFRRHGEDSSGKCVGMQEYSR
ncbi:hypothetical protein D3C80_2045950 [compost metagenome]